MPLEAVAVLLALAAALWMRPWRALGAEGPPWPWLAWWALLPALWGADRCVSIPVAQPLSGACLLMLMAGWPPTVLALVPVALLTGLLADLDAAQTLHRLLWLGIAPATVGLVLGAAIRHWLPQHLMVYILGRGFFATAVAGMLTGVLSAAFEGPAGGLATGELMLGRGLAAWGDAMLSGMLVAIFVAYRPQWLATYTDRLYLPR